MMSRFQEINRLHDYIKTCLDRIGMSATEAAARLWGTSNRRTWLWDISNKVTKSEAQRRERYSDLATLIEEPTSKVMFMAGLNPWSMRLSIGDQMAVWEFVERLVLAKELGQKKPSLATCNRLLTILFGGANVMQQVTNDEMAQFLKENADEEENLE